MIISYLHNFIYIRTRKTASSSIETLLRSCLGPDDVFVAQSVLRNAKTRIATSVDVQNSDDIAGHMKAEDIVKIVPEQFWKQAFKFTSERHPYEKAVSLAFYNFGKREKKGRKNATDFPQFLNKVVSEGGYESFSYYSIDGHVAADDFIRHESLVEDLSRIAKRLGLALPAELPQKRAGFRSDRRPAREILSEEQRRIVFKACRNEFELLGYEA